MAAKVLSWKQNSLELYGYGSQDYTQFSFRLQHGATIGFNEIGCFLKKEGDTESDSEAGLSLIKRGGMEHAEYFAVRSSEEIWFPVKHIKPIPERVLNVGMHVRFGRTRFLVQEIETTAELQVETPTEESMSRSYDNVCKICLSGSTNPKNPLLSICKCAGSMQFIHFRCAEAFVQSKIRTNNSPVVDSFHLKPVLCDLCHTELPMLHKEQDTEYSLQSMYKPTGPYLKIVKASDPSEFHFLHPSAIRSAIIGRGRNCDMKLTDASVSRVHASLRLTPKGYALRDEDSKFGTLTKAPAEFLLPFDEEVIIQVKQNVMHLRAVRPNIALRMCCKCCLKAPDKVAPRASTLAADEKCGSEPSTRRHQEEVPLEQHFQFP